jgi:hypothetical protein
LHGDATDAGADGRDERVNLRNVQIPQSVRAIVVLQEAQEVGRDRRLKSAVTAAW